MSKQTEIDILKKEIEQEREYYKKRYALWEEEKNDIWEDHQMCLKKYLTWRDRCQEQEEKIEQLEKEVTAIARPKRLSSIPLLVQDAVDIVNCTKVDKTWPKLYQAAKQSIPMLMDSLEATNKLYELTKTEKASWFDTVIGVVLNTCTTPSAPSDYVLLSDIAAEIERGISMFFASNADFDLGPDSEGNSFQKSIREIPYRKYIEQDIKNYQQKLMCTPAKGVAVNHLDISIVNLRQTKTNRPVSEDTKPKIYDYFLERGFNVKKEKNTGYYFMGRKWKKYSPEDIERALVNYLVPKDKKRGEPEPEEEPEEVEESPKKQKISPEVITYDVVKKMRNDILSLCRASNETTRGLLFRFLQESAVRKSPFTEITGFCIPSNAKLEPFDEDVEPRGGLMNRIVTILNGYEKFVDTGLYYKVHQYIVNHTSRISSEDPDYYYCI
jgi:hypothetical protein